MPNILPINKKVLILSSLVEGNSIRSTERITGVHRDTIMRLLNWAGEKAKSIMDNDMVNLKCNYVQVDEIWTFVAKKQKNIEFVERYYGSSEVGDQYVFVAMDSETKLVPCFLVGKRTSQNAQTFMNELRTRINSHFQLTSDSFTGYYKAVKNSFGDDIDYAQIHKNFGEEFKTEKRYSPAIIKGISIMQLIGKSDNISTSHIERQNLTIRMQMRRFTRLTNGFSKKLENLKQAVALHFFYYNYIRSHMTLGMTPAMYSGLARNFWSWEKFLGVEEIRKVI